MARGLRPGEIKFRYFDDNGNPLSNGKVFTYISGTTTPLVTWADAAGNANNTNPVLLDGRGEASIFLQPGRNYRFVVTDANDAVITTQDNIAGASPSLAGDWVNVKSFGAVGNGIADDTAAVRAALQAASQQKTICYLPAGTYKLTATLNSKTDGFNSISGIVGDSPTNSILDWSSHNSHGLVMMNPEVGLTFRGFRLIGPGQTAPVVARGISLAVDGTGPFIISNQIVMENVTSVVWPTAGFYWQLPIVSTYTNLTAISCGDYGFHIDVFTSPFIGGTSTQFNACYANNILGTGYYFVSHGYSVLASCAADDCNISYHFKNCFGHSIIGCGSEGNTYIDPARPGIAVLLENTYGSTIDTLWTYNLPNATSNQVKLVGCNSITVRGVSGYQDNSVIPTAQAFVDSGTSNATFINNNRFFDPNGGVGTEFTITDNGSNTVRFENGSAKGLKFKNPDVFGNSMYVEGGYLAVYGPPAAGGGINVFDDTQVSNPRIGMSNDSVLYFGPGTGAADTFISRSGVNLLNLPPVTNLTVRGASFPGITLDNTGTPRQWGITADNSGGLAFFDATSSLTPMYVWPYNSVSGQNGLVYAFAGLVTPNLFVGSSINSPKLTDVGGILNLTSTGGATGLHITSTTNPYLQLTNTTGNQTWTVITDNADRLDFFDSTNAANGLSLFPVNGVANQNGRLVSTHGMVTPELRVGANDPSVPTLTSSGNQLIVGTNASASLRVTGNSFPQYQLNYTASGGQTWALGIDTNKHLYFFDTTTSQTVAFFYPVNGVSGQNGAFNILKGLRVGAGSRMIFEDTGSNCTNGTFTLVAGTATINNNLVTANTRIILTHQNAGGTIGTPYVSARVPGVSFTVTSTSALDTSTLAYLMFEPN